MTEDGRRKSIEEIAKEPITLLSGSGTDTRPASGDDLLPYWWVRFKKWVMRRNENK